jgi:hypothetical protein
MKKTAPLILAFIIFVFNKSIQSSIEINTNWTLLNPIRNITLLNLTLPISVHTALLQNNLINDPLFRFNDLKYRWISNDNNWIFENKFELNICNLNKYSGAIFNLIFESIDTIASVYLNQKFILAARNQFLKYELFNISSKLNLQGLNTLQIEFVSPVLHSKYLSQIYPYTISPECPPDVQHGECHINFLRKQVNNNLVIKLNICKNLNSLFNISAMLIQLGLGTSICTSWFKWSSKIKCIKSFR